MLNGKSFLSGIPSMLENFPKDFAKTTCHWLDGKVMLTKETCEMILQSSTGSSRKLLKLNCKTKIILQGKRDTSNGDVSASSAAKAKRMTRIAPPLPPQQTKHRKRRCHRLKQRIANPKFYVRRKHRFGPQNKLQISN
jgi:hypothetical protein